ncbi:hypothetical protein NDU88_004343 [Pleurodeles waltl]|uniref:Uncharacterized protein n=1 Tax=Pleurodeles waltl TaxID=8319 RepID=A0AAV7V457_PLEWA|nr:hypothetical protein NDU88_004343 [Pleurodeles waltl]
MALPPLSPGSHDGRRSQVTSVCAAGGKEIRPARAAGGPRASHAGTRRHHKPIRAIRSGSGGTVRPRQDERRPPRRRPRIRWRSVSGGPGEPVAHPFLPQRGTFERRPRLRVMAAVPSPFSRFLPDSGAVHQDKKFNNQEETCDCIFCMQKSQHLQQKKEGEQGSKSRPRGGPQPYTTLKEAAAQLDAERRVQTMASLFERQANRDARVAKWEKMHKTVQQREREKKERTAGREHKEREHKERELKERELKERELKERVTRALHRPCSRGGSR